jgi:hypothetical protein
MLNEYEHDELNQAVKDVVYFATRRTLSDEEKALVEWMKKMLDPQPA